METGFKTLYLLSPNRTDGVGYTNGKSDTPSNPRSSAPSWVANSNTIANSEEAQMFIERVRAWNFKNFEELDLELRAFSVLVGANASGKSNTLELLKFVRDVATVGLDNAISLQGGAKYLTNLRSGLGRNFRLELLTRPEADESVATITPRIQALTPEQNSSGFVQFSTQFWQLRVHIQSVKYSLGIHFGPDADFDVIEDVIEVTGNFSQMRGLVNENERNFGEGTVTFRNLGGKIGVETLLPDGLPARSEDFGEALTRGQWPAKKTISLELPFFFFMPTETYREAGFKEIEVFDIDPKSPKFGVRIAAKADLEDDGENLALVLKGILEDESSKRKLSNLLKDLLPFVGDLTVEPFADRTFLFRLQESFFPDEYLPASLLSDGTINVTALIVALYFGRQSLMAFEEPERNLHPSLIAKVMQMLRDASQHKQIIITTHSPEVVRHTSLGELILVSRDRQGFSKLSRPQDKKRVQEFLKNEIGIEELYIKNMLEH
jgi:predicted ATPase